jgi:hypothetical protein
LIGAEYEFSWTTSRAMNAAANVIFAGPEDNPFILIGSTTAGEGAINAEVATRDRSRQRCLVRGFGVLGSGDFMGTDYRPRIETSSELAEWIERQGIGWVVIDSSPSSLSFAHNAQLLEIAHGNREAWKLAGRSPNSKGETLVYQVSVPSGGPVDHTELLSEIKPARMFGR